VKTLIQQMWSNYGDPPPPLTTQPLSDDILFLNQNYFADSNGDGFLTPDECGGIPVDVLEGLLPLMKKQNEVFIEEQTAKLGDTNPAAILGMQRSAAMKQAKILQMIEEFKEDPETAGVNFVIRVMKTSKTDKIPKDKFVVGMFKYIREEVSRQGLEASAEEKARGKDFKAKYQAEQYE